MRRRSARTIRRRPRSSWRSCAQEADAAGAPKASSSSIPSLHGGDRRAKLTFEARRQPRRQPGFRACRCGCRSPTTRRSSANRRCAARCKLGEGVGGPARLGPRRAGSRRRPASSNSSTPATEQQRGATSSGHPATRRAHEACLRRTRVQDPKGSRIGRRGIRRRAGRSRSLSELVGRVKYLDRARRDPRPARCRRADPRGAARAAPASRVERSSSCSKGLHLVEPPQQEQQRSSACRATSVPAREALASTAAGTVVSERVLARRLAKRSMR